MHLAETFQSSIKPQEININWWLSRMLNKDISKRTVKQIWPQLKMQRGSLDGHRNAFLKAKWHYFLFCCEKMSLFNMTFQMTFSTDFSWVTWKVCRQTLKSVPSSVPKLILEIKLDCMELNWFLHCRIFFPLFTGFKQIKHCAKEILHETVFKSSFIVHFVCSCLCMFLCMCICMWTVMPSVDISQIWFSVN